jgi:hypothetical protein
LETLFRESEWLMLNTGGDPEKLRRISTELGASGLQDTTLLKWAAELEGQKQKLQGHIDANGGVAEVWTLVDIHGRAINAKVVNCGWGAKWEILDASGRGTGKRLPYRAHTQSALTRRGYAEVRKGQPATAMIVFGVEGAAWAHVEPVPALKIGDDCGKASIGKS